MQEYLTYSIPGSTIFWAKGLPLYASPHELTEILMQLENGLQIPIDHAATLQHIQWQLQQGTPTVKRLPDVLYGIDGTV